MKTFLTGIILTLALVVDTMAQTDKGRWQVGAQLSDLSYQSTLGNRSTALTIKVVPSVGYFIRNNLLIGMGLPLSLNSSHTFDLLDERQVGIGPAPFVQYYIGASNLKPYLGVAYSYSYDQYRYKFPTAGASSTRKGYSETLTPTLGLAYFLNERVALNTGLSYNLRTRTVNGPDVITPQITLVTSESESQFLSVGFGIQVFLGR